ncbi:hypothetical protein C0585_04435 [Candidatus Woesearchaeota archaeon]|nr:MAG: hypothetical protein C0585_04435 [Candidatus Woesearchaeota archaeon]
MSLEKSISLEEIDQEFYKSLQDEQIKIYISKIIIQIEGYKRNYYSVAKENPYFKIELLNEIGVIIDDCMSQCYNKKDEIEGYKALDYFLTLEEKMKKNIASQIPSKTLIGSEILESAQKGIELFKRRIDYLESEIEKNKPTIH